ncbi:MAG TPA: GNAT family N-acetyltransferase [Galbitalea sp.]
MRARVVGLGDLDHHDVERWQALATRAAEPNPFLEPYFLVPAARHREDYQSTQLLLVEDGSDLLMALAFTPVKRKLRGMPINSITTGTPFLMTECERWHPLVDKTRADAAIECLLRNMRRLDLPSFIDLERMPGDGPLAVAWYSGARAAGVPIVERGGQEYAYQYRRDEPKPDAPFYGTEPVSLRVDQLSTRTRKQYLRALRDLEDLSGSELTIVDRGPDPEALEEYLRLQAAGWKGDTGRGGGAFLVTGLDRWFRAVTDSFRADARLSVFVVKAGVETIYSSVFFRSGNGLFAVHDAYNEKFAKFGAGSLGRLAVLSRSMTGLSVDFFDPSMHPKYVDSTHLFPDRRRLVSLLLAQRGVIPKASLRAIPIARRARDLVSTSRSEPGQS